MKYKHIPEELKKLNRWVCWKLVERKGKPTKIPINPKTGGQAMSNNSDTWADYTSALWHADKYKLPGIGFMFNGDGIVGVDLDNVIVDGQLTPEARDVIGTLNSYTEYSQSKKGLHVLCFGNLPVGARRKGFLEMYEKERFFIMTGDVIDDGHVSLEERTLQLHEIHSRYMNKEKKESPKRENKSMETNLNDEEIIKKASAAKNGYLFNSLFNGTISGHGSNSEADIALCNILAFWTRCDVAAMDRIFRRSGLYREKWDEMRAGKTYGEITIQKAISDCRKVYDPEHNILEIVTTNKGSENFVSGSNVLNFQPEIKESWLIKDIKKEGGIVYKINETAFVSELQEKYKLYYINGKLYNCDGLVAEGEITKIIQEKIEPYIIQGQFRKVMAIYEALCVKAYYEPPEPKQDEIHFQNISLKVVNEGFKKIEPPEFVITKIKHDLDNSRIDAPKWINFLSCLFEPTDILTVQEYIGYCFLASTKAQKALFIKSGGGEGKTILVGTLETIFGNTCIKDKVQSVADNKFKLASHENKLVFFDDDLNTAGLSDTGTWKEEITNIGKMTIEEKGKDPRQAKIFIRYFCVGNSDITSLFDNTSAFYDRILPLTTRGIKFRGAPDENKDLADELIKEIPAIITWAMNGLLRLHNNKYNFTISESTKRNLENMKKINDNVTAFLYSGYLEFGDYSEFVSEIEKSYLKWCEDNCEIPKKGFSRAFKQAIFESKKDVTYEDQLMVGSKRKRGYKGLKTSAIGAPLYINVPY